MRNCIHRRGLHARLNGSVEVFDCERLETCTAEPSSLLLADGAAVPACSTCPLFVPVVPPTEEVFARICRDKLWGDGESVCGPGSSLVSTGVIRERLPQTLRELDVKSLLDLPCGDHFWMSRLDLQGIVYIGADIVRGLIERLREQWPGRTFQHLDLVTDPLPPVDAVFVRDCLVHLPYRMIGDALQNIIDSGARWLITTHFPGRANHDIEVGAWRPLDLTAAPFRLPAPHRVINEGCLEGGGQFTDKSLGVWRVDDLRTAVARMSRGPKLAIGMACFRDWPGVWATIQSLRLNHAECLDDIEIIVVDNDPEGQPHSGGEWSHSSKCRGLCERIGAKYEHYTAVSGTAAAKGRIFELATASAVLVMDCHVLLPGGVVRRLINWFDSHEDSMDLWQGPCIGDGGVDDIVGTHFAPHWGSLMYGQWAVDKRLFHSDEPFEIDMQGCGLFACRRDAWPGFHPLLRGFGPEEFHIHQRIRRGGGRCYCLPWLRWCHRFGNPDGTRPPGLHPEERLRGHLITHFDTGAPCLDVMRKHFVEEAKSMTGEQFDRVLAETRREFG
jgi:hypothetical protein